MGIYLYNMEMPKKCIECRLMRRCGKDDLDFVCMPASIYVEDLTNAYKPRPDYCPLIEIPPHGDLIDRDALMKRMWDETDCMISVPATFVRDAPAIIPAEEGE